MHADETSSPKSDTDGPVDDAHGIASLALVESLIHGLCEMNTLRASDAIDIAERAVSVQFDRAEEAVVGKASLAKSHRLLVAIAESLRMEAERKPTPPRLVP